MKKQVARFAAKAFSRLLDAYNDPEIISLEEKRTIKDPNSKALPPAENKNTAEKLNDIKSQPNKVTNKEQNKPSPKQQPKNPIKKEVQKATPTMTKKKENREKYDVLLYAPISNSGLTTQAKQLANYFKLLRISFRITYYVPPKIKCFLCNYQVDENDIGFPKLILLLERYPKFDLVGTKYEHVPKVAYLNLDWLRENEVKQGQRWTEHIIFPNEHKNDFIKEMFPKAKFEILKWPSSRGINLKSSKTFQDEKIQVLYVGNDYDDKSRKSPIQVIDAICQQTNPNLKFILKFRNPVPEDIKLKLEESDADYELYSGYLTDEKIKELYDLSHINLIPNQCEGNGLSVIESISEGVIPAALDGYPMRYNIDDKFGYLIKCVEINPKVYANQYYLPTENLIEFFESIEIEDVRNKLVGLKKQQFNYLDRETEFYEQLKHILYDYKIIPTSKLLDVNRKLSNYNSYKNIDCYLTTSNRPHLLKKSLEKLIESTEHYKYGNIRVTVIVDKLDSETLKVIEPYFNKVSIISSNETKGLPFSFNLMLAHEKLTGERTESFCDYICYIQDDCIITDTENYFDIMIDVLEESLVEGKAGYVSGFYTPIHPGYDLRPYKDFHILLSDSIDGKNIFGHRDLFHKVGRLSWYFPNGDRRGNPGPERGSHFDLWQWKESGNCTTKQGLTNIIIPGLCENISIDENDSTWGNKSDSDEGIKMRVKLGQIYNTRRDYPKLKKEHFYKN